MFSYNNKAFRPVSTSGNSETTADTIFLYKQEGNIVTSAYTGGRVVKGHLIGIVEDTTGIINMAYHQVNEAGILMTGSCTSTPELLPNGKIRLHESWQWTSGDHSKGESVIEEI